MGDALPFRQTDLGYAKEYARFCRFYRLFLVDGLEAWRAALIARGVPDPEVRRRIKAAAEFTRKLAGPAVDSDGAG